MTSCTAEVFRIFLGENAKRFVSDECEIKKGEGDTLMLIALAHSYKKASRGPPSQTSPSNQWIAINSTYAFTLNALQRDMGYNPEYLGQKLAIEVLFHHPS